MARRAALPSLKHWHHMVPADSYASYEDYTIVLSPKGKLFKSRTASRGKNVTYELARMDKGRWYAMCRVGKLGVSLDANGYEVDEPESFSSAAKARVAANKHWQRGK